MGLEDSGAGDPLGRFRGRRALVFRARIDRGERVAEADVPSLDLVKVSRALPSPRVQDAACVDHEVGRVQDAGLAQSLCVAWLCELVVLRSPPRRGIVGAGCCPR